MWYVDEGSRREGLLRRCMSQMVRAHEGRGWRRWVWCTEESRRRAELASLSGMSERERAALEGRLRSAGGSMFAKALHRIGHRLLGMGWRRWWSVVHGSRAADARAELGMAHDAMASEMTGQLKLTAMGMMDKVVRRLEHGRVASAWGSCCLLYTSPSPRDAS